MQEQAKWVGRLLGAAINSIASNEGKLESRIDEELAEKIGLSVPTLRRIKAGKTIPRELRTIEILAAAGVKRGLMGHEWLKLFLEAADYPQNLRTQLIDELCPPHRPMLNNLPPATYTQFIPREQVFQEVIRGLKGRTAAVIITGMGGNGKTVLAREVAYYCLHDPQAPIRFDAVVWVSDDDRLGSLTLKMVLDEIARTLGYDGLIQLEMDEKRHGIEALLHQQHVLIVVDNCETISDHTVIKWLLGLPEPSKVLMATREYRRGFHQGGWPVELQGMADAEARKFIKLRAAILRISNRLANPELVDLLLEATGRNPKAMAIAIGLLKYEERDQVVSDLYALGGEVFNDLFSRSWSMLDPDGQRVLMAMVLFPQSACSDALRVAAGIERRAFRRVIEQLRDMALVDVQQTQEVQTDGDERYILHPLTRTFARAMLNQRPELEGPARHNLARWCIALAEQVGYVPQDLEKLALLDPEQNLIPEVLRWMLQNGHYQEAIALSRAARYYYYIRGHWKMEPSINMVRFEAARQLSDKVEQVEALAYHCQLLSKQGYTEQIGPVMEQLDGLAREADLPDAVRYEYYQAMALCHRALAHYAIAQQIWDDSVDLAKSISIVAYLVNRRDFSDCLQMQEKYQDARQLLDSILSIAQKGEYSRIVLSIQMRSARIDIQQERLDAAERKLATCRIEEAKLQDRTYLAELLLLTAQLHKLRGDLAAARSTYMEAIEHYKRLGKFTALRQAQEELARLDELDAGE